MTDKMAIEIIFGILYKYEYPDDEGAVKEVIDLLGKDIVSRFYNSESTLFDEYVGSDAKDPDGDLWEIIECAADVLEV